MPLQSLPNLYQRAIWLTESAGRAMLPGMTPPTTPHTLPALPGTYALLIPIPRPITVAVGRLGTLALVPGWVAYVGSAHGPGGLRARVTRHCRAEKRRHWHIDYLTQIAPVDHVWAAASPERLECAWAAALRALPGAGEPLAGFGASDCGCTTHLISLPGPDALGAALAATTSADVLLY